MDMDKILQWMDIAKKYQTTNFWDEIFENSSFNEFMKNHSGVAQDGESPLKTEQGKKFPPTDIYMTDEEILLVSNLAGYPKENIQVSVSGIKLLIRGSDSQMNKGELVQQEIYQGDFQRIIQLPEPAYPNQIRARFHNGLLFISYNRQFRSEEQVPIE
ncbi:Hsp20/alpha crystallin family protein [Pseudobacillus wudalianchiensis]|uniref:Spore coat protein n=1 Tax=Pseudobacillus wudalianchiensis TaxID=1743143 RepID=A0A1B9B772_9BACI|nr:Hsp20/alpha crystallin family protein [Bacillus wudalianchiensis]OCA91946.1 spore coat protein [Bacillus wudalianchiensis]